MIHPQVENFIKKQIHYAKKELRSKRDVKPTSFLVMQYEDGHIGFIQIPSIEFHFMRGFSRAGVKRHIQAAYDVTKGIARSTGTKAKLHCVLLYMDGWCKKLLSGEKSETLEELTKQPNFIRPENDPESTTAIVTMGYFQDIKQNFMRFYCYEGEGATIKFEEEPYSEDGFDRAEGHLANLYPTL